jgi:hypothetical protein
MKNVSERDGTAQDRVPVTAGTGVARWLALPHAAWLVAYPAVVGLLLFALPARFADLTAEGPGASLLRPAGGAYAIALFGLEVLVLGWYVANTLLMAWRR